MEAWEKMENLISKILGESKTIAVVGLLPKPYRASHDTARYLQQAGYRIIPVNPLETEILGERCYPDLLSVPDPVDVVDVFRRPEYLESIARESIAVGAKTLWMQQGIVNHSAAKLAEAAGLNVIMDRCMKVEHMILRHSSRH
jgi:predicted CoA-binding protein